MPWHIEERDGEFCVINEGGENEGCHETREMAERHMRALHAAEPDASVIRFRVPFFAADATPTDDGRVFDAIDARPLPLPLAFQTDTQHSNGGTSDVVGQVVELSKFGGVTSAIIAVDPTEPEGERAIASIRRGGQGISMDGLVPPDAPVTEECTEVDESGMCVAALIRFTRATIGGATLTPIPAWAQAVVDPSPLEDDDDLAMPLVASAAVAPVPALLARSGFTLTAGAAVALADWSLDPAHFERPTLTAEANYINVEEDGRVWGWIAPAERCHQSFPDRCVLAANESPDLSDFLRNAIPVGDRVVPLGFLTMDMGHANGRDTATRAAAHYDDTRSIAAIVTAGIVPEGEHSAGSVWFSGSVSPRLDPWQRTVLAAGQASGDWRADPGERTRTLRAALVVPVPGFLRDREPVLAGGTGPFSERFPTWDPATQGVDSATFTVVASGACSCGGSSGAGEGTCGCGGSAATPTVGSPLTAAQTETLRRLADERISGELAALDADLLADLDAGMDLTRSDS